MSGLVDLVFIKSPGVLQQRVSASKSEAMVLKRERVGCHFQVSDVLLFQIEKHKYLQFLLREK